MPDSHVEPGEVDPAAAALRHVRELLNRFRAGDTAVVLADEASQEAASAVSVQPTPEAVAAVAWLYQYRALAVGEIAGEDAQLAFALFGKVAGVLPRELPPHVAQLIALGQAGPGHPIHRLSQTVVEAEHLLEGSETSGNPLMLDRAIGMLTDVAETWPEGSARRHEVLGLLGRALRRRYAFEPAQMWLLERAVAVLKDAVEATPAGDLTGHMHAHNLCSACLDRYEATGDLRDLDAAEQASSEALRLIVGGDSQRPRLLTQRADVLRSRTSAGGEFGLLGEAADLCREAVRTVLPDNPAAPPVHAMAASVLSDWYVYTHDPVVLDEAIRSASNAVTGIPEEDDRHSALACHGRLLMLRAQRTGDLADHDAAERALTAAVGVLPPGHSARTAYLGDLADALYERHRTFGDESCLRAALDHARCAVDSAAEGGTANPALLDTLGRILVRCYDTTGDPRDLDSGVERLRQAEEQSPPGSRMRALALLHLGNGLMQQAALVVAAARRNQVYAEAMTAMKEALQTLPPGPDSLLALNNLGTLARRQREEDRKDGQYTAQRIFRDILSSTAKDDQAHQLATLNLALSLLDEHEAVPDGDRSLQEAEELLRTAQRDRMPGQHSYPTVVCALARCLSLRSAPRGRRGPDAEAVALLRSVMDARGGCPVYSRVSAAVQLGGLFADVDEWAQAQRAYAEGLDLLTDAVTASQGRSAQEHGLGTFFGLASHAAACAIGAGDPVRAVELLERGRGLLLPADARPASAGKGGLLATGGRTIAIVNVSKHRCDALLVSDGAVSVVPLPRLSHATLIRQAATFLWAVQRAQDPGCRPEERYKAHRVAVPGVLRWLWHSTVRPVLDSLGLTGPPANGMPWPRVWWCPTGMMSFLPLHAAGEHRSLYDGSAGDGALDRVVSSYTPTLRTLGVAAGRAAAVRAPEDGDLLVVAPQTPGTPELPQVPHEMSKIRRHHPGSTSLLGAEATKERILVAIQQHSWFHFAGHGVQNVEVADSAHLLPHDYCGGGQRIDLSDLGQLRLDKAQLAFLSACRTAVGQLTLADEHAHVAGLLQSVGFPHVIATQWTVRDGVAAAVSAEFYQAAARRGRAFDPASALHAAMREVRRSHPEPYLWAPFVHFGP